jgi:excisionase family DNA binding protein
MVQQKTLLTEKEQAQQLNCSWRHLVNLRERRLILFIKLGKLVRYNPEAVQRALEKLTVREIS